MEFTMKKFKVYWHHVDGSQTESTAHTIEQNGSFIVAIGDLGETWMRQDQITHFVTQFIN